MTFFDEDWQRLESVQSNKIPWLSQLSDASGNTNIRADYSSSPTDFSISGEANKVIKIFRVKLYLEDTTIENLQNIGNNSALTNGLKLFYQKSGESKSYIGVPIKKNLDMFVILSCRSILDIQNTLGTNHKAIWGELEFDEPLVLLDGDKFGLEVNDNTTIFSELYCTAQGSYYTI